MIMVIIIIIITILITTNIIIIIIIRSSSISMMPPGSMLPSLAGEDTRRKGGMLEIQKVKNPTESHYVCPFSSRHFRESADFSQA